MQNQQFGIEDDVKTRRCMRLGILALDRPRDRLVSHGTMFHRHRYGNVFLADAVSHRIGAITRRCNSIAYCPGQALANSALSR